MKLSQAIRKGAAVTKPYQYTYVSEAYKAQAACALGAAAVALHGWRDVWHSEEVDCLLYGTWPELRKPFQTEFQPEPFDSLHKAIEWLNDTKSWTREQIADYLDEEGL